MQLPGHGSVVTRWRFNPVTWPALVIRVTAAFLCSATLAAQPVSADPPCDGDEGRIEAYSRDRYAVRSPPNPVDPGRSRFLIRRLGTDETLDQVDCPGAGPCELTTALGMRGCSYAPLSSATGLRGLSLRAIDEGAPPRWELSIDGGHGRVALVSLKAAGTLTLRAAVHAGQRVLVFLSESDGGACPHAKNYAVVLDDSELRTAWSGAAPERLREIDLRARDGELLPPPRTAKAFRSVPIDTIVDAARTAAVVGMAPLATCWIMHNASIMPARELAAFKRVIAEDPLLSQLVPSPRESRHPLHIVSLPSPTTITVDRPR